MWADALAAFSLLPSTRVEISCIAVIKEPEMCLVRRGVSLSTASSALAAGPHHHIASGNLAQPGIAGMFSGSCPHGNVTLATTRVPDFSEPAYRQLVNGFRELGDWQLLLSGSDLATLIPEARYDPKSDIPSVDSRNPISSTLAHTWQAMEVNMDCLFILIFHITPTIHRSGRALGQFTSLPDSLFTQSRESPLSFDAALYLPPPVVPPWDGAGAISAFGSSMILPPDPVGITVSDTASSRSLESMIRDMLSACVENYSDFAQKARFVSGTRATLFTVLARNYYAMSHIILALGFDVTQLNVPHPFIDVATNAEMSITASDVLRMHGWATVTFENKAEDYIAAEKVAHKTWNKAIPASGTPDYEMFSLFGVICYLWRNHGPLDPLAGSLCEPNPNSEDSIEQEAAIFKQVRLEKCARLRLLKNYLGVWLNILFVRQQFIPFIVEA
ncbi:hypothetical protein R3P38DRAFT_3374365 [Favolaschia claudopus]|uniref:Uncharacterized protein n=1 Tax=Favolaschia claudopus TaxID=2862362 RepID=A0AAV9ZNS6_9AGAR